MVLWLHKISEALTDMIVGFSSLLCDIFGTVNTDVWATLADEPYPEFGNVNLGNKNLERN